jgi:hypothetical protein
MAPPLVMAQESQRPCQATTTAKTIPKILPAMASRASSKALALMSMDALDESLYSTRSVLAERHNCKH